MASGDPRKQRGKRELLDQQITLNLKISVVRGRSASWFAAVEMDLGGVAPPITRFFFSSVVLFVADGSAEGGRVVLARITPEQQERKRGSPHCSRRGREVCQGRPSAWIGRLAKGYGSLFE